MEKKRCKIVFEEGKGTILDVVEKEEGWVIKALLRKENEVNGNEAKNVISSKETKLKNTWQLTILPNVSAGEYAKVLSVYTDKDGKRAVVPPGFTVSGVPKENIIWGMNKGLVIYRIPEEKVSDINWLDPEELEELKETYDQFVWTPVSLLKPNGTLDGVSFNEKFGRRKHRDVKFSEDGYHEDLVGDLALEKESTDKYDGYYSTRYDISIDKKTGKPRSVKGKEPLVYMDGMEARTTAKILVEGEIVNTHFMYESEYDTIVEWVKETKTMSPQEIAEDSTKWGNYWNTESSPRKLAKTGSREEWSINNMYDFVGNIQKLTQERREDDLDYVIRGGSYVNNGYTYPVAYRYYNYPFFNYGFTGFRATLYIK